MIYVPWVVFALGCIGLAWVGLRAKRKEGSEETRERRAIREIEEKAYLAKVRNLVNHLGDANQAPPPTEGAAQGSYGSQQQQSWRH